MFEIGLVIQVLAKIEAHKSGGRASYTEEPNCPDGVAGLHNDWEAANDPWNAIDDSSLGHAGHRRIPEPR